jgi:hypothetical protein
MEWMLQVADELDDVIGALRLCCVGLRAEMGPPAAGCPEGLRIARGVSRPAKISEPPLL